MKRLMVVISPLVALLLALSACKPAKHSAMGTSAQSSPLWLS